MSEELISIPKLVDNNISSGIITFNSIDNPKDKVINFNLELLEENNQITKLNFGCEYFTLVNINYKMKSALNNIDEVIKNYANK